MFIKKLLSIFLIFLLPLLIMAEEEALKEKEMAEMSLEELLNMEVTTVTKKAQKMSEAPGIITVITAEDIENMGAQNLYEVLSMVPGVEVVESFYGYSQVIFRGVPITHYNNKAALFVNGHPMDELTVGSFYLESIPINVIKKIEIIRGPGSALYGSSAFSGIINIITKTGKDVNGTEFKQKCGVFFEKNAAGEDKVNRQILESRIATGKVITENYDIMIAGSLRNGEPFDYNITKDEAGASGTIPFINNFHNVYCSVNYEDMTINGFYWNQKRSKYGLIPMIITTGDRKITGYGFDIRSTLLADKNLQIISILWFDYLHKSEDIDNYPAPDKWLGQRRKLIQDYSGYKLGTDIQLSYKFLQNLDGIFGIYYQSVHTDPYYFNNIDGTHDPVAVDINTNYPGHGSYYPLGASAFTEPHDTYDAAPYIQLTYSPIKRINMVGGIRINYNKNYGLAYAPRAGIVLETIKDLYLKVLYGSAYRNPSFFELYVNTFNVLQGNPDLKPEKIDTIEAGLDYKIGLNVLRVNYFYNVTDDLITRCLMTSPGEYGHSKATPMYGNSEGQIIQGVEVDIKGFIIEKINYFVNGSYRTGVQKQTNSGDPGNKDIYYLTGLLGNAGISAKILPFLRIGTTVQYIGERKGKALKPTLHEVKVADYALWNLMLKVYPVSKMSIGFVVNNVTDTKYNLPESIRRNVETIPQADQGRTFYLELNYAL